MANGVAPAFDTYEFVKRLTSAGLPVEAAETFAKEQSRLIETVASKEELKEYKSAFKEDFKHLEDRLDAKFEAQRKDNEISRKHAESLVDKAKFHLLSWMVALTLGPTVFRNLWQFLSITSVSH